MAHLMIVRDERTWMKVCQILRRNNCEAGNITVLAVSSETDVDQVLQFSPSVGSSLKAPSVAARDEPWILSTKHALKRWAAIVVGMIEIPDDPKTLSIWARSVGVSVGCIRSWCSIAHLSPRSSLYFGRILRAVVRHHIDGVQPEEILDVCDPRTLDKLLLLGARHTTTATGLPSSVDDYLERQRWITDSEAKAEVKRALETVGSDRSKMLRGPL